MSPSISKNINWSLQQQLFSFVMNFVNQMIMARLLVPKEYGVFAMVTVFSGLALQLMNLGMGQSLVRKSDISQQEIDSLFTLTTLIGLGLSVLFFFISRPLTLFYGVDELNLLTQAISPIFLISGVASIPSTLMTKELRFKQIFWISIVSLATSYVLAIYLAYHGYGVFSLVAQMLCQSTVRAVLLLLFAPKVGLSFEYIRNIREHINFGLKVSANTLLNYLTRNLDNAFIGKNLGSVELGYYSKAYSLMMLPLSNFSIAIGRVLFPTLSSISEISERRSTYMKSLVFLSSITFPLMVGAFVLASELVLIVFGENWLPLVPVFRIMCFSGMVQSVLTTTGPIFLAQNRPDIPLKLGLWTKPILFVGLYLASLHSIEVTATYFVTWSFSTGILQLKYAFDLLHVSYLKMLKSWLHILAVSLVMGIFTWGLKTYLLVDTNLILGSGVLVSSSVPVYFILLYVTKFEYFREFTRYAISYLNRIRGRV